jgi:uncharacterized protein Smg (DUF494 family)
LKNSILWQTYLSLSALEQKHFGQWLQSPFFCRKKALSDLLEVLKQCRQDKTAPEQEALIRQLKLADITALRLLMSELLEQLEQFLIYGERAEMAAADKVLLAAAYRKRGLDKHFQRTLREGRRQLDNGPYRHSEYYETLAALEYEHYQFQSSGQRTESFNLQALLDATDLAFLTRKLRQACFILTHQTMYKTEYRPGMLPQVLEHVVAEPVLLEQPAIALYFYCYRFLKDPEDLKSFELFKEKLLGDVLALPPDMQRDLHLLAINYCVKKINRQQNAYYREALELYRSALRADLLLENGYLSPFAYNNIVAIALKVGEGAWAETFVETYAARLESKFRSANHQLNLARVAYARKDYGGALLHLQEADYKDLINNLIAKTLVLKIYYETNEFDALDAHLQSMQSFLRRQKVIGYHLDNFRNIIRLTRKLMQARRSEMPVLRSLIEQTTPLSEKEWLLEMIN